MAVKAFAARNDTDETSREGTAVNGSLEEALRPVVKYISDKLVSADGLAAIGTIARQLPGGLTSCVDFECHLGRPERRADFLVRTRVDGGESERLADVGLQHPLWARLREYARQWGSTVSPLHRAIDRIWLEFDLDGAPPVIPLPSVFLCQGPDQSGWPPNGRSSAGERADSWLTDTALPLLQGPRLPSLVMPEVIRCLDLLPARAMVFSVGVTQARDSNDVRLCIADLGCEGIVDYLNAIGWSGPMADVTDLLTRWPELVGRISLHVDVGETVRPRLGLDYHGPENDFLATPSSHAPACEPFLDALVRDGLCRAEKRDGLLTYPGFSDELRDGTRWPERLLRASRMLGPQWVSVNHRSVQYIKIVYEPGKPLDTKAYLSATYGWFNRAVSAAHSQSSTDGRPVGLAMRSNSKPIPAVP